MGHLWEQPWLANCERIRVLCLLLGNAGTSPTSQPSLGKSRGEGRKEHVKQKFIRGRVEAIVWVWFFFFLGMHGSSLLPP